MAAPDAPPREPCVRSLRITGRVQGVGYRVWAEREARARGLDGWVRNRRDGSVEACVAGEGGSVQAFIEMCRIGPPGAAVREVAAVVASADLLGLRPPGRSFAVIPSVG